MAIPKFEDFLFPFLTQLKGKDVSSKEMKEDFRNTPFHNYYLDPLHCGLIDFKMQERQVIQTSYTGIFI